MKNVKVAAEMIMEAKPEHQTEVITQAVKQFPFEDLYNEIEKKKKDKKEEEKG